MKRLALLVLASTLLTPTAQAAQQLTFASVKPIMDRCVACHEGYSYPAIPDLGTMPFAAKGPWAREEQDNEYWIRRVVSRMNLREGGKDASMPPAWAWESDAEEVALVIQWVQAGAPDLAGARTLDERQVERLLK